MVNDLHELMQRNVAHPPHDDLDLADVITGGRRRVRRRRGLAAVGTAAATAVIVGASALVVADRGTVADLPAAGVPRPDAPLLRLTDAEPAVEGEDYRVVAAYTNDNLNRDNGQYFDGVTDDGLVLFRDGPRADLRYPRLALMDPATGEKDWLPALDTGQSQLWPVELGTDRLVLLTGEMSEDTDGGAETRLAAQVFDRDTREWSEVIWPSLPAVETPSGVMGPDGRLYVFPPARQGQPPEGGWPTGPGGEAEDADAGGETHHLWSVSLTDNADVRDEGMTVGDLVFTSTSMVWTDSTNGAAGRIHVRDLASGEDRSFDPRAGERCNLLGLGATDDRVVLGQYCGTYDDGVRDDRIQILTTTGEQVATIQDSGAEVGSGLGTSSLVPLVSSGSGTEGSYVYDLESDAFLRLSDDSASWSLGTPTPDGLFMWTTPVNFGRGATQWIGELAD